MTLRPNIEAYTRSAGSGTSYSLRGKRGSGGLTPASEAREYQRAYLAASARATQMDIPLMLAMVITVIFIIMVFCLLTFHIYLCFGNLTTWETSSWNRITYLKRFAFSAGSPFSKSLWLNFLAYFFPHR